VDGSASIQVRFWGVRGSIASPGPGTARYGGNTSCLEVRCGPHLLIFDAGTGIRPLGQHLAEEAKRSGRPLDADLFLTHTHYDHISGLPFFGPAYDGRNRFRLWEGHLGPDLTLQSVLCQLMTEPLFPVPLNLISTSCSFNKFQAGAVLEPRSGVTLRTVALNHPNEATGYRIEHGGAVVCYMTDLEHTPDAIDPSLLEAVRGADLLIYDSTYTDAELAAHTGWGHSTWQQALRLADAAGVGRVILFHHDPARTDDMLDEIGRQAASLRPGTLVAAEGMVVGA